MSASRKPKPSIRDVAMRAGVSPATVSQILNNKLKGSEDTRRRVIEAVSKLGYAPDLLYRNAVLHRNAGGRRVLNKVIAFISHESIHQKALASDGFYSQILRGIQQGVAKGDYGLLLKPSAIHEDLMPDFVLEKKVDGVLVEGGFCEAWREELCRRIPVCFVFQGFTHKGASSVRPNMVKAAHDTMSYLTGLGHRNIVTLSSPRSQHHAYFRQGIEGFFENNERPDCRHFMEELTGINEETHDAVLWDYARRFVGLKDRPTAIFAGDVYAVFLVRAFRELGLSIPRDLSIIGFDDTLAAQYCDPQLTSYRLSLNAIGSTAVEVLLQQIEDPDRLPRHITLDGELIERASAGHAPRAAAP